MENQNCNDQHIEQITLPADFPKAMTVDKYKKVCIERATLSGVVSGKMPAYNDIPEGVRAEYNLLTWKDICLPMICDKREKGSSLEMLSRQYGIPKTTINDNSKRCAPCCGG